MKILDIFSGSKVYNFKKGQVIIRPDEEIPYTYYIVRGFINIYSISSAGQQKDLIIFRAGHIFPLVPTVRGDVMSAWFFEAMTDVDLLRIPRLELMGQIKNDPAIKDEIIDFLVQVIKIFRRRIDILEIIKSDERIIEDILFISESFGVTNDNGSVVLNVPITHKDIASRAGVTRETVSREISKLEKKGLVGYNNHMIVINNLNKLKEELETIQAR